MDFSRYFRYKRNEEKKIADEFPPEMYVQQYTHYAAEDYQANEFGAFSKKYAALTAVQIENCMTFLAQEIVHVGPNTIALDVWKDDDAPFIRLYVSPGQITSMRPIVLNPELL